MSSGGARIFSQGGGFFPKGGGFSRDGRSVVYVQKLKSKSVNKMQGRWDVGHEGCRTVVIQTGGKLDRRDAGQEGCRTGRV